jgi:phosphonate degradation associated HDIG domain protein
VTATSIDTIIDLFERWGRAGYDEDVAQLDHALQTAALATEDRADEPLIAAALLHDVGHLLDLESGRDSRGNDLRHEDRGAAWLRPLLPASVAAPIALHVRAKRYLCAVDPAYEDALSPGSARSLAIQGGSMTPSACKAFNQLPGAAAAIRLRRWDDAAKVVGLDVPPLDAYRELLTRVAHS